MIGNLIDLLITRTADGNIKWYPIIEKWGCEYGRMADIQTRNHTLKIELYYTDVDDDIENAVLIVYDSNYKLSHSTSGEYPNMKELAMDLFKLQIDNREKVLTEAFRSLGGMVAKERVIQKKPVVVKNQTPKQKVKTKTVVKEVTKEVIKEVEKKPKWKIWLANKLDL